MDGRPITLIVMSALDQAVSTVIERCLQVVAGETVLVHLDVFVLEPSLWNGSTQVLDAGRYVL
jgi:hypothetical protein